MTPEERARKLVYKPDWIFLYPEGVSIRISAAIRAAVAEEREACALLAGGAVSMQQCASGHESIAAAIRARE